MDSEAELQVLHEAIFGTRLKKITSADEALKLLETGKTDIIMNLNWGEKRGGEVFSKHKIILQNLIDGEKVVFYNPLGHDPCLPPGTVIEGAHLGPRREVVSESVESISIEDLKKFFAEREAVCYVSE